VEENQVLHRKKKKLEEQKKPHTHFEISMLEKANQRGRAAILLMTFLGVVYPACVCESYPTCKHLDLSIIQKRRILSFMLLLFSHAPIVHLCLFEIFQ
jgi:hypothetical protein